MPLTLETVKHQLNTIRQRSAGPRQPDQAGGPGRGVPGVPG
jgi:hypothetical protein